MLRRVRQCLAVALLLSMAVAFTVGSVGTTANAAGEGGVVFMRGPYVAGMSHDEKGFTRVYLDLSDSGSAGGIVVWHAGGPMPPAPFATVRHAGGAEFIAGKMTVIPAGEDTPMMFPVMFFRHDGGDSKGMAKYTADTTLTLSDSTISFMGEIEVPADAVTAVASTEDAYDNDILAGETNWHQVKISGTPASLSFELKWNDSDDALRVVVYTPDGNTLGPYYDDSDGTVDGAIDMTITNSEGVADGTWTFKVTDTSATGSKDEYYLKTW